MSQVLEQPPLVVHTRPVVQLDDAQFFAFCQLNPELQIERNCAGDILIMAPTAGSSGRRNFRLAALFGVWEQQEGSGQCFDSSTGFRLPNGAIRSPDLAWVAQTQLTRLAAADWQAFLPLCPDFVLELRSPSDALVTLQEKMEEYLANGCQLGWLIDPSDRSIVIYQPKQAAQRIEKARTVSGEPILKGLTLDLREIWNAVP